VPSQLETRNSKLETAAADYFSLFALPRKLNLDTAALERDFYAQSRKLHPDRFAAKSLEEQAWATEQSSLLNDAYRTLKDPIARTEYLLSLEGVQLEEQSKAATDAARERGTQKKQVVPPELLEEVFELNMQLQEIKMAHQMGEEADADTREGLEAARANFTSKLNGIDDELRALWSQWDVAIDSIDEAKRGQLRDKMVEVLNRRSYIRNLVRDVTAALET
jgi:molecular chaperone HscB